MTIEILAFISHSWSYSDHYEKLAEWLFDTDWKSGEQQVIFYDASVPRDNPIHSARSTSDLRDAIFERISASNIVLIPTGMYANYSDWIQAEIDGANYYSKPILAIDPWDQQRTSSVVNDNAHDHSGWQKKSVIAGIWRLLYP